MPGTQKLSWQVGYLWTSLQKGMTQVQQENWNPAYSAFEQYLAAAPAAEDRERVETWMQKIKEQTKQ